MQHPKTLGCLVKLVGYDRVVLGSDHLFWMGDPEPVKIVDGAGLSVAARAAILGENATRIFHRQSPCTPTARNSH